MTNKKLLYGALLIGAVAGLYFWNKNKKSGKCVNCEKTTDDNYSSVTGSGCRICQRANGSTYLAKFGMCADGDFCITSVRTKSLV
jgi:hypothetical protein